MIFKSNSIYLLDAGIQIWHLMHFQFTLYSTHKYTDTIIAVDIVCWTQTNRYFLVQIIISFKIANDLWPKTFVCRLTIKMKWMCSEVWAFYFCGFSRFLCYFSFESKRFDGQTVPGNAIDEDNSNKFLLAKVPKCALLVATPINRNMGVWRLQAIGNRPVKYRYWWHLKSKDPTEVRYCFSMLDFRLWLWTITTNTVTLIGV